MISNTDNNTRLQYEVTDIYGLDKLVSVTTRITENTSTLKDVIFTNCPDSHSLIYAYRKHSFS